MHSAVHANIFMKLDYEVSQMRITWQDGTIKKKKRKTGNITQDFDITFHSKKMLVFFTGSLDL